MNDYNFAEVPVLWKPNEKYGNNVKKFKKIIEDKYNTKLDNYWDLHKWSIDHIPELWSELWEFSGLIYSKKYEKVVDLNIPLENSPPWFQGAELNYAENILKHRDDKLALIVAGEDRPTEKITHAQLYKEAELYAAAFRKCGLKKGDIVVCQMSNRKEAVIGMIAVTSIGAIWAGALPLLGAQAVLHRFKQVKPKMFLTVDQFPNEKKIFDMLPKTKEIVEGLPTLEKVIIVASKEESYSKDISGIKNSCFLKDFLEHGKEKDGSVPPMQFEQVTVNHPLFINYTSGTTGLPKPIVHGTAFLLTIYRDFTIHFDSNRDSIWFSMSPVGWATWNCFASNLFAGSAVLLFEGVPYFLSPNFFWDMVDEYKVTHLFISSSTIDEFEKRGCVPTQKNSLESLKIFMAGGSVVKPQSYDFIYEKVKKDVAFASAFGSTEMLGSGLVIETSLPIHRGEIPALSVGVSIETVDDNGKSVHGEIGEFVVTRHMPNLPLGLWGDKDGSVFREKYFSKYPGKFAMNDYGIINPVTKGIIICYRSDDTLKQRGCRFGSAEIYNVVETFPEVRNSLCVSHYKKNREERAVLFLKIRDGYEFNQKLVSDIRAAITRELTARHVPDIILETKDIPYSVTGKKTEIVVKKLINKMPYNTDAVINPEALKHYHDIPELDEEC